MSRKDERMKEQFADDGDDNGNETVPTIEMKEKKMNTEGKFVFIKRISINACW